MRDIVIAFFFGGAEPTRKYNEKKKAKGKAGHRENQRRTRGSPFDWPPLIPHSAAVAVPNHPALNRIFHSSSMVKKKEKKEKKLAKSKRKWKPNSFDSP